MSETFEELYRRHRQGLYTLALSITGSHAAAEDSIQNAFSRIFRNPPDESADVVAYVFKSVRNAAIDQIRDQSRQRRLGESIFTSRLQIEHREPGEILASEERDELLMKAIDELTEQDREAVVLKAFSGLTFEQAGKVADLPPKTIATRYRRALHKLEKQLKGLV